MSIATQPHSNLTAKQRGAIFESVLRQGPLSGVGDRAIRPQYGNANGFKILPGGMYIGGPNLQTTAPDENGFAIRGALQFLPNEELHLAVYIRENLADLIRSLGEMTKSLSGNRFIAEFAQLPPP